MAMTLLLRASGIDPCPHVECDAPRLVLGRAPGCDLQLPDPSVSRRHATLRQRGSHYVLVDEGSDNGTYIGRERLESYAPHRVHPGDLIRLGRVWVQVAKKPGKPNLPQAARELARQLVSASLAQADLPSELTISVLEEDRPGKKLALAESGQIYSIGRTRSADLTVKEPTLAPRALEVQRTGDQLRIRLLDQGVDILLAGKPLEPGRRTAWPPGAILRLGQQALSYQDPVAACLGEIEKNETEELDPQENVKPPAGCKLPSVAEQAPVPDNQECSTREASVSPPPSEKKTGRRWAKNAGTERWTFADSVVLSMALGILGASLWAAHWVVHFNPV